MRENNFADKRSEKDNNVKKYPNKNQLQLLKRLNVVANDGE